MKKTNIKNVIFFAVLSLLTITAFIIPLRPDKSYREKRELAKFPKFSLETLLSGDYFDDISYWFADTFPGRETWLDINEKISALYGFGDSIDMSVAQKGDEIPVVSVSTQTTEVVYPQVTSQANAAEITPKPTATVNIEEFESESYGAVMVIDGSAYSALRFSLEDSNNCAAMLNRFGNSLSENGIKLYFAPAPTSVGIMIPEELSEKLNCSPQGEIIEYLASQMNENVITVNSYDLLKEHSDEYLYFHSDHHWTALGAYYHYLAFCDAAGINGASLDEFDVAEQGTFKGSSYSSSYINTSKLKEDYVTAYVPKGNVYLSTGGTPYPPIIDKSNEDATTKYLCFLNGDRAQTVIVNDDLPNAPDCIVLKDSFGNPFVEYLTANYHKVYVLDYRYYESGILQFALNNNVSDIIVCLSVAVTQTSGPLTCLSYRLS